jgi:hypothetical protein
MNTAAAVELKSSEPEKQPVLVQASEKRKAKPGPQGKKPADESIRYFLAKEGSTPEKPELGEEVKSEGDAIIRSFRSNNALFFAVAVYRADVEMTGGTPTLVKRPAQK